MRSQCAQLAVALLTITKISAVPLLSCDGASKACVPSKDPHRNQRKTAIEQTANGWTYGISLIGDAAPYPGGDLGIKRNESDYALWQKDRADIDDRTAKDVEEVKKAIAGAAKAVSSCGQRHSPAKSFSFPKMVVG